MGEMTDIAKHLRMLIHRGSWVELCDAAAVAADEIDRLNEWADGFSDAQLKERQMCEARIQEMQRLIDERTLALMMIREGCADPAKFAGEQIARAER